MIAPIVSTDQTRDRSALSLADVSEANETFPGSNVVTRVIGRHPIVALAAAGLVGISIGWLVKRRES